MQNINLRQYINKGTSYAMPDREKYRLKNGCIRPMSLTLDLEMMALRTIGFKQLTRSQIEQVHKAEQTHLYRRFILPHEIRKVLNWSGYKGGKCSKDQLEFMKNLCKEHKPKHGFEDYSDQALEGDGMNQIQEWDLIMWELDYEMPSGSSGGSAEFIKKKMAPAAHNYQDTGE